MRESGAPTKSVGVLYSCNRARGFKGNAMKRIVGSVLVLATLQGCGPMMNRNGFELSGSIGMVSVQKKETSTVSNAAAVQPLICEWFPSRCQPVQAEEVPSGS